MFSVCGVLILDTSYKWDHTAHGGCCCGVCMVCMYGCVYHNACAEVRGQLVSRFSLLPLCGFSWAQTQALRLMWQWFYTPGHFTSSNIWCFVISFFFLIWHGVLRFIHIIPISISFHFLAKYHSTIKFYFAFVYHQFIESQAILLWGSVNWVDLKFHVLRFIDELSSSHLVRLKAEDLQVLGQGRETLVPKYKQN